MLVKIDEKSFDEILSKLKQEVYEYNTFIKGSDIYLKPFHIVYRNDKKYIYIGKYWYKLQKINGKIKWIYLGKKKPANNLPDPPRLPEVTIIKEERDYIIDNELLNHLK
ncbi:MULTISPECIES: hypothetical protein [Acidianus]|nr:MULTISPECIES: hypothetical protein [Acidianus]NON63121.1 hypothetical protein [Acidianus sp. RZ1]